MSGSEVPPFLSPHQSSEFSFSVELRPPRVNLSGPESMDHWIDTYHAIRRLTAAGRPVFITDNAVGQHGEENLRHLVTNLGQDVRRSWIVPFLTSKHPSEYCLRYAERAFDQGFETLVVLGGDRHDGVPRCVEHAFQLRGLIRKHVPGIRLGGWANPHRDPQQQAQYLSATASEADFYLTQIVSHHDIRSIEGFLSELEKSGIQLPGVFGVFYYRSGRQRTLEALGQFFPVPVTELQREFETEQLNSDEICARTIRGLRRLGIRRIYISNLPIATAAMDFQRIAELSLKE